jgi:hypothetical protein
MSDSAIQSDLVPVEMGPPRWRPPDGTCHLVTYGASRARGQAAARLRSLMGNDSLGSLKRSWWIRAWRWTGCTGVPRIRHEARIHHANQLSWWPERKAGGGRHGLEAYLDV